MDETSGNRADSHTNGLTLTDNNTVGYATGKKSNCASFTPSQNESLSRAVAKASTLDITGDMTIAFWMKHHDASPSLSNDDILNRFGSSGDIAYRILMEDGGIYFMHNDGTTTRTAHFTSADPAQNTWAFLVFVVKVSSSTVELFLNGTSLGTQTIGSATRSSDKPLVVGKWSEGISNNLNADIEELAIWSRAISSTEVTTLHASGAGLDYAGTAGIVVNPSRGMFALMEKA